MAHTEFSAGLQNTDQIEITVTGRTSGRSHSYPVWFILEGETLFLLPVQGSDTGWYKNVLKTPSIRLTARGKAFATSVRVLTDESEVGKVVEEFQHKYGAGQVKAYYPKHNVAVEVPLA